MKKFYNCVTVMLCFAGCVNGQTVSHTAKHAADNFTSFTSSQSYTDMTLLKAITSPAYYNHPDFGKRVADSTQWYEQIDKRTLKTRTYRGSNNEVITESGYSNLNYTDASGWLRTVNTKLTPAAAGWCATQQEIPVYLYKDGSTALTLEGNNVLLFNKNVQFNNAAVSITGYTVGDNGMYIKNAAPNTDKIIRFGRGRIETDYSITQPLKLTGDLIISEDIIIPAGFTLSENENYNPAIEGKGSLIVTGSDGTVAAELKSPFCYDSHGSSITGTYHLQKQNGGYRLQVEVPSAWLNNSARQYPVTIDPVVTGSTSLYSGGVIGSCIYPAFDTASIEVIVPASVTITNFYVQGDYYAPVIDISHGYFSFQTSCLDSAIVYAGNSVPGGSAFPGWLYAALADNDLVPNGAVGCYNPSCSPQSFRLVMGVSRDTIDTAGCNARYIYYDPSNTDGFPFEAYVVGHTVETTNFGAAAWSVSPDTLCGNNCQLQLHVTTNNGVPPYKISHPWASDTITYGNYDTSLSTGTATLILTLPNCPDTSSIITSLIVFPPAITDACGNSVTGLASKRIVVSPAPHSAFGYTVNGNTITFSDSSVKATSWTWEFGDGDINTKENPVHTYNSGGTYSVTLIVSNGICIDSVTKTIDLNTGIAGVNAQNASLHIYPNPAANSTTVEFISTEHTVQLTVVNVLGQILYSKTLTPAVGNTYRTTLDVSELPAGIYDVVITTLSQSMAKEVIKQE